MKAKTPQAVTDFFSKLSKRSAKKLDPEFRVERAKKAAAARWARAKAVEELDFARLEILARNPGSVTDDEAITLAAMENIPIMEQYRSAVLSEREAVNSQRADDDRDIREICAIAIGGNPALAERFIAERRTPHELIQYLLADLLATHPTAEATEKGDS